MACRIMGSGAVLCALWATPALALTVTNQADETIHVWIENWMYRLREGQTATFNPTEVPAAIIFESQHMRITCEAAAESEVRVTKDKCIVDGVEAGDSRIQL
jgi:hypothetical protein